VKAFDIKHGWLLKKASSN